MSLFGRNSPISFPTYILPSLPFIRKNSSGSTVSASSVESRDLPGPGQDDEPSPPRDVLPGHMSYIRCSRCAADLCMTGQIVSKGFQGRFGRAYLVAPLDPWSTAGDLSHPPASSTTLRATTLPNTHSLQAMRRNLVTGGHTVSDVICAACGVQLGWRYIHADEESQRYKVGKFILEAKRTTIVTRWEDDSGVADGDMVGGRTLEALMNPTRVGDDDIEFDSQDEDECEDLFMGQWTPERAAKRRKAKLLVAK